MKILDKPSLVLNCVASYLECLTSYFEGNLFDNGDAVKIMKLISENKLKHNSFKGWKFAKETEIWHMTTLFKGNKGVSEISSLPSFKEFIPGKHFEVNLRGMIYIPGNLITAFAFPDKFSCENKFPHITLMYNGYLKPKNSHDALLSLFSGQQGPKRLEKYKQQIHKANETAIIKIDGYDYRAFIVYGKSIVFNGEMSVFFK